MQKEKEKYDSLDMWTTYTFKIYGIKLFCMYKTK